MGEEKRIIFFTNLLTWQKGHQLVILIYKTTESFPERETFALINQMRRAAVSITSNIAEGFSRKSLKEKVQFYYTALGSLTEVQNQLLVARDVGYLRENKFKDIILLSEEVAKLINGLIRSLKSSL
jgi:four helix bundle protein